MAPAVEAEATASRSIREADTGIGAIPAAPESVLPVDAGLTPGPEFAVAAG
jgi:hypothetical protein